jgi:hypothetical protein
VNAVAEWLVARPLNAIIGLAAAQSLPLVGFLSGAILVYLVLQQGLRPAALEAAVAGALIVALAVATGMPLDAKLTALASVWMPALLMSLLLLSCRSLTLTLQVAVIMMVVSVLMFFAIAGNPVEFWTTLLTALVDAWREAGLNEQADLVGSQIDALAEHMTVWVAFVSFGIAAVMLLIGYTLYRHGPGEKRDFGRFLDLNLGRVIATVMAVTSVVALLTQQAWLQSVAFVMFAVFSLQGIAIMHWMQAQGRIPVFMLVLMYGAMVVLSPIIITAMAVLGYIDAWFDLRRLRVRPV